MFLLLCFVPEELIIPTEHLCQPSGLSLLEPPLQGR